MFPVNNTQKDSSYCSVPLCSNYVGEYSLSFHYFPIDNKSREGWQAALNLDAPCTRYMRICSEHFKKSDFLPGKKLKKRLKKNVIPSLKLPVGHYIEQLLSKNQSLKSHNIKLENGEKDRNKNDMGNVHDETTYVTKIKSEICEANYHKTDGNQHENICEKTDATSELPYEFGSPSGIILLQEKIKDEVSMEEKSIFYNTNDESIYENDPLLKHDDLISLRPEENHGLFIENSRKFYQRNMKSTYVNTSCDIIKSELNETNDYKKSELSHPEKISTKTEIDDQSPNQYKLEINEELIIKEEPDFYYVDENITGNISTNKNGVEHEIPEGNHYTPENNLDTYSERHLAPVLCNETQTSLMEYKTSLSDEETVETLREKPSIVECKLQFKNIKITEEDPSHGISNCAEESENIEQTKGTEAVLDNKKKRIRERDYCFYCKTTVLNFARHLIRNHETEIEVQKILSMSANSTARKHIITSLRKMGNYIESSEQVKPMKKSHFPTTKLVPCPYCMGFYASPQLWRHRKKCPENKESSSGSRGISQDLLIRNFNLNERLKEKVFPLMRVDNVSLEVKKDPLICEFGARYLKTHRQAHFRNVTSRKMRELARLLIEIKKIKPSITNLFDALRPQNFDVIVQATKTVAKYDSTKNQYFSPTYAINIETSLKQCCDAAILQSLRKKNVECTVDAAEVQADLKTLIHLIESNWKLEISAHAVDDLQMKKCHKISIIPLASDLRILKEHLSVRASKASSLLVLDNNNKNAYTELLETVYCKILLLNRKQPDELQRILLSTFKESLKPDTINHSELSDALFATEKILIKTFHRIVITRKRGRATPVLVSRDVQEHLKLIVKTRSNFVSKENLYLFGNPETFNPICGYKAIAKFAKSSGAQNPKAITSSRLRQYLAILTQIFNMSKEDIEQLANFMDRTSNIHWKSYRLPDDVYQTAKLAKLLILMEKGSAENFKGKSLEEIDINMEEDIESEENKSNYGMVENIVEKVSAIRNSNLKVQKSEKMEKIRTLHGRKRRNLVPWTEKQKEITKKYFENHIKTKQPPKKHECEKIKNKYPGEMANKDWLKIKVYVQNLYTNKCK